MGLDAENYGFWSDLQQGRLVLEVEDVIRSLMQRRPAWHALAACRGTDPSDWVPKSAGVKISDAQAALCASCPVRGECLAAAVEGAERGVWGGQSEAERKQARRDAA